MADFEQVLSDVGPRLRALRQRRGTTLADLSAATGISVSTLSRLESGRRRPNLELLLPLAEAHGVPLDDLVGAPATGDPRIHLRPLSQNGRTIVPLTRRPGGVQAYKMVIPAHREARGEKQREAQQPDLKVHEGYEWMYVLNGKMRLLLGQQDLGPIPGRGGRVRHPAAALVRQRRGRAGGVPVPVRAAGGTRPPAGAAQGHGDLTS